MAGGRYWRVFKIAAALTRGVTFRGHAVSMPGGPRDTPFRVEAGSWTVTVSPYELAYPTAFDAAVAADDLQTIGVEFVADVHQELYGDST